ncbi:MAG: MBL fold metallo-hydrolase [Phycisphaerae bacterium]|nr:MBL fold metallo-hydrolase [Phycisphaerae bacterium]
MKIQISTFVDRLYGENAYVVRTRDGGPCWIIDPGLPPSPHEILAHLKSHNLQPAALILTHGHLDHIAGVPAIREALPSIPIHIANDAKPALTDPDENLSGPFGMGMVVGDFETIDLPPGGVLTLDNTRWRVFDTSGHAPGSRSLYCESAGIVIVGDALFQGSVGRVDFHHSQPKLLIENIRENLLTLPDETVVFSGHGPTTTIGDEKRHNPYLREGGIDLSSEFE